MKNNLLLIACLLAIGIASCKKDCTNAKQTEPQPASAASRTGGPDAAIYVNSFSNILGDSLKEDSLLNWSLAQGFTQMNLYNISTILGSNSSKSKLNNFIYRAHSGTYGLEVCFVASSASTASNIGTYCVNYANKPDRIVTEYEFWNGTNSFSTFSTIVSAMTTVYNNTTPPVEREGYVSQYSDAAGITGSTSIIQSVINNCDNIVQVNYSASAYSLSGTLSNKLQAIANEANSLGTVANITILFNVNTASSDPNIYAYFSTTGSNNNFVNAYNNLMNDYNNSPITNKASLNIHGYAIYRYSDARLARP